MPAPGAIQAGQSGTQLKEQLDQYPCAGIWQVPDDEQARLAACPHLDALAGHIRTFAEMTIKRQMYGRAGFALLRKRHPSPG
jgi:hypothetical protein